MKLWKISQTKDIDWNMFISAVVAASSEDEARNIHPDVNYNPNGLSSFEFFWVEPKDVIVQYLGEAAEGIAKVLSSLITMVSKYKKVVDLNPV